MRPSVPRREPARVTDRRCSSASCRAGPGKVGQASRCIVADRQDVIEGLVEELGHRLGSGPCVRQTGLVERAQRQGIDHSGRPWLPAEWTSTRSPSELTEQRLGHDRAAAVAGAQDEDSHGHVSPQPGAAGAEGADARSTGDEHELPDPLADLGEDPFVDGQALRLGAGGPGRVRIAPVQRLIGAREDRTDEAGVVAERDDVVEALAAELVDRTWPGGRPDRDPASDRTRSARGSTVGRVRPGRTTPRTEIRRRCAGPPRPGSIGRRSTCETKRTRIGASLTG